MQNLIAKEIVKYDRHFLGRMPEETISKTWDKEEYLNDRINDLIYCYYNDLWKGQKRNDVYGEGFRKFVDLSKDEAKELALNYMHDTWKKNLSQMMDEFFSRIKGITHVDQNRDQ